MLLLLILYSQWTFQVCEAKYIYLGNDFVPFRAESLHSYDVLKYELDVNVPMTGRTLNGLNKIKCRSNTNGLNVATLHSYTLTIDSVMVDNQTVTYSTAGETLHINLPQTYNYGDSFSIYVYYHGSWGVTNYQTGFCYWPKNYNSNTLHSIAYTLGEPWDARRWMPCFDEPFDKSDQGCIIKVTTPDSFVVCANGNLLSVVNNPDGTKTWTYEETRPITTYLIHFGISKFAKWSQWYHDPDGDSVELRHFIWPEDSIQSLYAFSHLPDAMYLFDSLYGDYPFDRYGQDAVYPFAWGGMEHQQQTTIHRWWVLNSSENGMAHELAHQWWGDMVTCIDFRDIWLNEGFATYSDANYNWFRFGYEYFIATMESRRQDYFNDDAQWRHPIYDPPLSELFNWGHTYCKGSWVLHMLRYLNPTAFFNTLSVYRDSFEYGCASTEDLKNIFSQAYGTDLTWFFDEWVYDQGYPVYNVYWDCQPAGGNYLLNISIHQDQTNAPPVFHMPVQILIHMGNVDSLLNIPINSSVTNLQLLVSQDVDSIEFDPNTWLLCQSYIHTDIAENLRKDLTNGLIITTNPARNINLICALNQKGRLVLYVYDVVGRLTREINLGDILPGRHKIEINDLSSGVYFVKMVLQPTGSQQKIEAIKKLILMR